MVPALVEQVTMDEHDEVDFKDEQLLTAAQVCRWLGVTRTTLHRFAAADPTFPKPMRLAPRTLRYQKRVIRDWLNELRSRASIAEGSEV